MEQLENGKVVLNSEEYIPKKLGRKLVVFLITAVLIFVAFLLSNWLEIDTDKLEIACKWIAISGISYGGTNATIDGVTKIASALKKKNGG